MEFVHIPLFNSLAPASEKLMRIAATLVAVVAATLACAVQGQEAHVSQASLAALGLRSMQPMSDVEGLQVRGRGTVLLTPLTSGVVLINGTGPLSTSAGLRVAPFGAIAFSNGLFQTSAGLQVVPFGAVAFSNGLFFTSVGFVRIPFGAAAFANGGFVTSAGFGFVGL
jgi:hypothetical protein